MLLKVLKLTPPLQIGNVARIKWIENNSVYLPQVNKPRRISITVLFVRTGLSRGEQDGSRCQHEFASLVCLRGVSVEKNTAISLGSVHRRPGPGSSAIRISYSSARPGAQLTRLSVVSTETLLFFHFLVFQLHVYSVFFWNGICQTRNWQKYGWHRWKIVGFVITSRRIRPRTIAIYSQDDSLVFFCASFRLFVYAIFSLPYFKFMLN